MKKLFRSVLFVALLALVGTACGGSGSIEVEDARYRLARSDLGAGYMTVTNGTGDSVTLEAVSAPGVGRIELHESLADENGAMTMESRPDGFEIGAGETLTLEPGGKHLMLFDPEGTDDLTFTLDFGSESIDVVAAYDAEASADTMDHDEHDEHDEHGDMDS